MYDKFGQFNSVEELNKAAEGFKNEGDLQSLYELAEENGISREDAEDYADGYVDNLATETMAAYGRAALYRKEAEQKNDTMLKSMISYILLFLNGMILETDIQKAVMDCSKSPEKLLGKMKQEAKKHASGAMGVCCGTDKELKTIIHSYYTESEKEFEQRLEELYK